MLNLKNTKLIWKILKPTSNQKKLRYNKASQKNRQILIAIKKQIF